MVATFLTARATSRAVDLTREQLKQTLRPVVVPTGTIEGARISATEYPEYGTLYFTISNLGAGPAFDVRMRLSGVEITAGPDIFAIGVLEPREARKIELPSRPRHELIAPDMIPLDVVYRDAWDDRWYTAARTNSGRWEAVTLRRAGPDEPWT